MAVGWGDARVDPGQNAPAATPVASNLGPATVRQTSTRRTAATSCPPTRQATSVSTATRSQASGRSPAPVRHGHAERQLPFGTAMRNASLIDFDIQTFDKAGGSVK